MEINKEPVSIPKTNINWERKPEEDENVYTYRVCENKDVIGSWQDVADILNRELNHEYTESKYRKTYQSFNKLFNVMKEKIINNDELYIREQELLLAIKQERQKLNDLRALVNNESRVQTRTDDMFEKIVESVKLMQDSVPFVNNTIVEKDGSTTKGILLLSDWHIGLDTTNSLNTFNMKVAKRRINKLFNTVLRENVKHNIDTLYVANIGDVVSGLIHTTTRLESREKVMEQVMNASELIAELLYNLSKDVNIEYYSVFGNHDRIFADKKEAQNADNYCTIIDWFLKHRFLESENVNIHTNEFDDGIGVFSIYNHNYCFTHGDKDNISNIVSNISLMTKRNYDAMFMGHRHSVAMNEVHGTYVIQNGTLSGVDEYAVNIRKSSRPSQTLVVVSEEDPLETLRIIKL